MSLNYVNVSRPALLAVAVCGLTFSSTLAFGQCDEHVLVPSLSAVQDHFGQAIAFDDDNLLVGSTALTGGAHGAAFLFEKTLGGWSERQVFLPPSAYPNQSFGAAVALYGDTLMIQEVRQDPAIAPEGGSAIHVYQRQAGTWQHVQRLTEPGYDSPGVINNFGRSVDLHENVAYIANRGGSKVHVFTRVGAAWISSDTVT